MCASGRAKSMWGAIPLKLKNPQRIPNPVNGFAWVEFRPDLHHPDQMVSADDVNAGMPLVCNHHPVSLHIVAPRPLNSVIPGIVEWGKREEFDVLQMMIVNPLRCLFDSLSPIHVGIVQILNSTSGSAGEFVEIRNVVGKGSQRCARLQREEKEHEGQSQALVVEFCDDPAPPDKEKWEYRQRIANAEIVGPKLQCNDIGQDSA